MIVGETDSHKGDALRRDDAKAAGVDGLCVFTGWRDDLPGLYAAMDVCVLPSHREGFPRVPMEASAMGVPVVATEIRGCREAVESGVNGVLVPVRDAGALAHALEALLSDLDARRRLGAGGRRSRASASTSDASLRRLSSTTDGCCGSRASDEGRRCQ